MEEQTVNVRDWKNIKRTIRIFLFFFLSFHGLDGHAAIYYISGSGSNILGNGSLSSPWATINYGISRLSGGDTLIVQIGRASCRERVCVPV